mgnify:CR=1 FL=1
MLVRFVNLFVGSMVKSQNLAGPDLADIGIRPETTSSPPSTRSQTGDSGPVGQLGGPDMADGGAITSNRRMTTTFSGSRVTPSRPTGGSTTARLVAKPDIGDAGNDSAAQNTSQRLGGPDVANSGTTTRRMAGPDLANDERTTLGTNSTQHVAGPDIVNEAMTTTNRMAGPDLVNDKYMTTGQGQSTTQGFGIVGIPLTTLPTSTETINPPSISRRGTTTEKQDDDPKHNMHDHDKQGSNNGCDRLTRNLTTSVILVIMNMFL